MIPKLTEVCSMNMTIADQCKENNTVTLEEALTKTGFGWYNYRLLIIEFLSIVAMAAEVFGISFILPASQCDLGLNTLNKGIIGAVPMLAIVISAHMWGYLTDTQGRRPIILVSLGLASIFSFAASFSKSWIAMAVLKFLSTLFVSATQPVTYTIIGESMPIKQRNKMVLLLTSGLSATMGFISLTAYIAFLFDFSYEVPLIGITYRPWRLMTQIYSFMCALCFLLNLLFVYESPKFYLSRGRKEECLYVLNRIHRCNHSNGNGYNVENIVLLEDGCKTNNKETNLFISIWNQTAPMFYKQYLKHTAVIFYCVILVYSMGQAFAMWLPTIANAYGNAFKSDITHDNTLCMLMRQELQSNRMNGSLTDSPIGCEDHIESFTILIVVILGIFTTALSLIASVIVNKIGKNAVVIITLGISFISVLSINFVHNFFASIIVFMLSQTSIVSMGVTTAFTLDVFPTYLRAMAVCLTIMVGRASGFISINLLGNLMVNNCENLFYFMAGYLLSGIIVAFFLCDDISRKILQPLPEKPAKMCYEQEIEKL